MSLLYINKHLLYLHFYFGLVYQDDCYPLARRRHLKMIANPNCNANTSNVLSCLPQNFVSPRKSLRYRLLLKCNSTDDLHKFCISFALSIPESGSTSVGVRLCSFTTGCSDRIRWLAKLNVCRGFLFCYIGL